MQKYILWDLDGTIVDSENVQFKTEMFNYTSSKIDLKFNLQPELFIGNSGPGIYAELLKANHISDDSFDHKYAEWYASGMEFIKENVDRVHPRQNSVELWRKAHQKGIKNVVVTSSRTATAHLYMKNIDLHELCETYTCEEDVQNTKPHPEPYLITLEKLNIQPHQCIVIEDSISGVTSAKSAGLFTIAWVEDVQDKDFSIADRVYNKLTFEDITTLIHS